MYTVRDAATYEADIRKKEEIKKCCVAFGFLWRCHLNFWPKFLRGDNGRMSFL